MITENYFTSRFLFQMHTPVTQKFTKRNSLAVSVMCALDDSFANLIVTKAEKAVNNLFSNPNSTAKISHKLLN